jgi:DNA-3-methyladenine glycosylase
MSTRDLFAGHATGVAPLLLGALLTSRMDGRTVVVRLTEVEAYGGEGEDPGSHAYRRLTPRNATMFGPPGHAYEYFTYGTHWMLNVVTQPDGVAGAVLLRAGEVVDGAEAARQRRPTSARDRDLARGPARLAMALGMHGVSDGIDLLSRRSPLRLALAAPVEAERIGVSARTGVSGAGASTPWRFFLKGETTVSPYRRAVSKRRRRPPTMPGGAP